MTKVYWKDVLLGALAFLSYITIPMMNSLDPFDYSTSRRLLSSLEIHCVVVPAETVISRYSRDVYQSSKPLRYCDDERSRTFSYWRIMEPSSLFMPLHITPIEPDNKIDSGMYQ